MTPESLQMLFALLIGFAVAGMWQLGLPGLHHALAPGLQPLPQSRCSSCLRRL